MEDCEFDVDFEDFDEAKEYILCAFTRVIDCLSYLCEQIRAAKEFEELDLGWWEPLLEKRDGDESKEPEA
jgi:hypothetical protein